MYVISKLVRKGLGGRRKPPMSLCYATISSIKAEGSIIPGASTGEESNVNLEEEVKMIDEIDALFCNPLRLFEQCCFTIRRSLRHPKRENLRLLPLPKLLCDQVMFPNLCREIVEQIKRDSSSFFSF